MINLVPRKYIHVSLYLNMCILFDSVIHFGNEFHSLVPVDDMQKAFMLVRL